MFVVCVMVKPSCFFLSSLCPQFPGIPQLHLLSLFFLLTSSSFLALLLLMLVSFSPGVLCLELEANVCVQVSEIEWEKEEWEGGGPRSRSKTGGANKINCNQGNNSKSRMQRTVKMSYVCVRECFSVCVYVILIVKEVYTLPSSCHHSSTRVPHWRLAPSWCKSNWKTSNYINQVICFLVSFALVWEDLVHTFPPYLEKYPPADTSNAAKTGEMGM